MHNRRLWMSITLQEWRTMRKFNEPMFRDTSMDELRIGESYIRDLFFKEIPNNVFFKDKAFIGWNLKTNKEEFYDTNESSRAFVCGLTGSGKTFLLRSIMSRLKKHKIFVLADVKGEFMSQEPVQGEFRKSL